MKDNPYLYKVKERDDYPKQTNEHNALSDALFIQRLHYFLQDLPFAV